MHLRTDKANKNTAIAPDIGKAVFRHRKEFDKALEMWSNRHLS